MKLRKYLLRTLLVLAACVALALGWGWSRAMRTDHPVGFQLAYADAGRAGRIPIAIWYPTSAAPRPTTLLGPNLLSVARDGAVKVRALPLVVISHGNGGGPGSHVDLAMALADAGYVVAAPIHPGDNYVDEAGIARPGFWAGRNQQLRRTIDFMLQGWSGHDRIDPARIGAFGFSAGGFTVLTAAGAVPDLAGVKARCEKASEFVCTLLSQAKSPLLGAVAAEEAKGLEADPRIRAVVVAAPGLGFTMARPEALAAVRVPVQLWAGAADDRVPPASNAELIRSAFSGPVEYHSVPNAGHMSFLAPCTLLAPPGLCSDSSGFDRTAFHREMNRQILRFFAAALPPG